MEKIKVFAPASIANFSVGFDCLGYALNSIGDIVELKKNDSNKNKIVDIINGPKIPKQIDKNCCGVVIEAMQKQLQSPSFVDISIKKGFNSGSGLGSSSASCAAAAVAYNELMNKPFSTNELIEFAGEGERVASGSVHFDNVAPAVAGGLMLTNYNNKSLITQPLPIPSGYLTIAFLDIEINTKEARGLLGNEISLFNGIKQWSNMGLFIASLYENDIIKASRFLNDNIAEPVRKKLIPLFDEVREKSLDCGALNIGISGSGPSIFILSASKVISKKIEIGIRDLLTINGKKAMIFSEEFKQNKGAQMIYKSEKILSHEIL